MPNNRISIHTIEACLHAVRIEHDRAREAELLDTVHEPSVEITQASRRLRQTKGGDSHYAGMLLLRYTENPAENWWRLTEAASILETL